MDQQAVWAAHPVEVFCPGPLQRSPGGVPGVEFRWNFSDKETPIEYYIISDTAINFQLAFFYEEGSIADQASDLWKIKRVPPVWDFVS